MNFKIELEDILSLFPSARTEGSTSIKFVKGIASLKNASIGDLSFLGNRKYRSQVVDSGASVLLLPIDYDGIPSVNQLFLKMPEPSLALARVCQLIEKNFLPRPPIGIHSTSYVEPGVKIKENVSIGPFCYIGKDAEIGEGTHIHSHCHIGDHVQIGNSCKLHPGVRILDRCRVGNRVILNSGVVIGSEGYGFEQIGEEHEKIPHLGIVIVEDDVEIGANTCVDRARFEESKIGKGSKIDNLVQIGHNVRIGNDCLIVAQVGISGSVQIDDQVIVGGQAGFAGHLKVGKGAKIAGQAGITKDVEPGSYLKGNPALPVQLAHRISVLQRKLPELFNRFAEEDHNK